MKKANGKEAATPWILWAVVDFSLLFFVFIFWQIFGAGIRRRLTLKYNPNAIAVMNLEGTIRFGNDERNPFSLVWAALNEVLRLRPKALILRINSPGGTVGASQEIYSMIRRISNNGTKVVACLEDVAASGGLYVALAANRIVAHPGTITGSIGVIMQTMEYSAVLERFQIKVQTIKSGEHKDIMSPARPMTEEEKRLLHETVMSVYEQFCEAVSISRNIPRDAVSAFADGRIFSGAQAFELGIVDEHSSFLGAIDAVCGLAGINSAKAAPVFYRYRRGLFGSSGMSSFFSKVEHALPDSDLRGVPLWLMPNR